MTKFEAYWGPVQEPNSTCREVVHGSRHHWIIAGFLLYFEKPSKFNPQRGPDVVAEEIATVLVGRGALEFKALFTIIFTNLRAKNMGGGEEMLRLRVYEKLQNMVKKGMVDKKITKGVKEYLGLASLSSALPPLVAAEAVEA